MDIFCNRLQKVKKFFIKYLTDCGNGCIMKRLHNVYRKLNFWRK